MILFISDQNGGYPAYPTNLPQLKNPLVALMLEESMKPKSDSIKNSA